ncbi:hypothetical protein EIP91_011210 [Steccherinum ochraceum]|uniref:Myb/SANT-like domain-containing protein n=1 Tax=Steccherinum ochraceum TaxID=92696 RepID=A0A4R0R7P9_9APHY|nr:hypothetical protein EIP91_011210 [Steccherinum ochraceum]
MDSQSDRIVLDYLKSIPRAADNNYKGDVYTAISVKLAAIDFSLKKAQVKSYWSRLKTNFTSVRFLRKTSGFGWDDEKKVVFAEEKVWRDLLYDETGARTKKYNLYNPWRSNSFPWYDDMVQLLGDVQATGQLAFSLQTGAGAAPSTQPSQDGKEDEEAEPGSDGNGSEGEGPGPSGVNSDNEDETQETSASQAVGPTRKCSASVARAVTPPPQTPLKRARSSGQVNTLNNTLGRLVDIQGLGHTSSGGGSLSDCAGTCSSYFLHSKAL